MSNFTTKLVAGLTATIAHAAPAPAYVRIGDLDLASKAGMTTFNQRVAAASHKFCRVERSLGERENCELGVRAEAHDKLAAVIARSGGATTLAAR
jgi:UrcA family protein